MARMVRKQIYITAAQDAELKRRSRELGISEASLIREYIHDGVSRPNEVERNKAWLKLLADMDERASRLPGGSGKRTWTREDLYEDRIGRFSR